MNTQWNPDARMQREVDARKDTGEAAIGNSVTPDVRSAEMKPGQVLKSTTQGMKVVPVPQSKPVSRSQDA